MSNIFEHKEFFSLYNVLTEHYPEIPNNYLQLGTQQKFINRVMNINTNKRSLHLYHSTGSGKTIGALNISTNLILAYSSIYRLAQMQSYKPAFSATPTVFILGFSASQKVFKKELMRFAEFGIITHEEILELKRREEIASSGIPTDIKFHKEFRDMIKRRITNKNKGGFYQFLGYEELVNRLFFMGSHKLQDLEDDAIKRGVELETIFAEYIENGAIQLNVEFLKLFNNSMIIADEVHITYNNARKNDRGIALQYIIDKAINLFFLSLSATPFKSNPRECIDWINLHLPLHGIEKFRKEDFFQTDKTMYPNKLAEFGKTAGKFTSFFQDMNPKEYPERIFSGETLSIASYDLPYLKFIRCDMSPLHQATYSDYMTNNSTEKLGNNVRSLIDLVFPNPIPPFGMYKTNELVSGVLSSDANWRRDIGIDVKKTSNGASILTGTWLKDIGKYSTKFAKLLTIIGEIVGSNTSINDCQKMIVYHQKVRTHGVLLIEELLIQNGFIEEFTNPTDYTLCWICGVINKDHNAGHTFTPARFIVAHHGISKLDMENSLDRFNNPINKNGVNCGILVGSKIISESYDFKDIQQLIILSTPSSISSLIQIFGRAIRKNASINLPPEQRKTIIRILVSTSIGEASYELKNYANKLSNYINIQKIEQVLIANALDFALNWDTTMANVDPNIDNIGTLYIPKPEFKQHQLLLDSFYNYGYSDDEVLEIIYTIKRLFVIEPIWTYDNLLNEVRSGHIKSIENSTLFSENNFVISLTYLLNNVNIRINSVKLDKFVESIFNPNIRVIYKNNIEHKIKQIGEYYILFPVNILKTTQTSNLSNFIYNVIADVETYNSEINLSNREINIDDYLNNIVNDDEFNIKFNDMLVKLETMPADFILYTYSEEFQIRIVENAIINPIHAGSKAILDLFQSLDVIIMTDEVIKYQTVSKYFKKLTTGKYIGYCLRNNIKLYLGDKWIEVDKIELNRHMQYKRGDLMGYLQDEKGVIKFKIITGKVEVKSDKRQKARGLVCAFRDKDEVLDIAAGLGISLKKYDAGELKIGSICNFIRDFLISREIGERTKKSNYSWLSGWWSI
jgi:hypothetical protein